MIEEVTYNSLGSIKIRTETFELSRNSGRTAFSNLILIIYFLISTLGRCKKIIFTLRENVFVFWNICLAKFIICIIFVSIGKTYLTYI